MNTISQLAESKAHRLSCILLLLCAAGLLSHSGRLHAQTPRQFMQKAKLGLFVHYVYGLTQAAPGKPPLKNLNDFANCLNVQGIADVAQAMGAQYVIFTAYHWRMNMLLRCPAWKKIFPSHVSNRDVVGGLAKALRAKGIKLVLYMHPDDRHDFPRAMINKLIKIGFTSRRELPNIYSGTYPRFEPHDPKWNRLYEQIVRSIAQRYGGEIAGYWIDDGDAAANGVRISRIIEQYTPGAAVWLNGFATHPPATLIGSEVWNLLDSSPKPHLYNTSTSQAAIVIADVWWACKGTLAAGNVRVHSTGRLMYPPSSLYRFLLCQIATSGQHNGGVVYATSPYSNNHWEAGVRKGLTKLGAMVRKNAIAIYNTIPSRAYVSGESAAAKPLWGVAVDSPHGSYVYLHVLMPPQSRTLHIAKPADAVTFRKAQLLNGGVVRLVPDAAGYALTLPHAMHWSKLDTVIRLTVRK